MWSYQQGVRLVLPVLTGLLLSVPSFADSQVRIVRLSDVEGEVQIDRNTGQGFEKASVNLPITEGVTLRTGHDGFAAVEFEDGSSFRMTPGTFAVFTELKLRDSGARASVANLRQGMAYVNYMGTKNEEFSISFGSQALKLDKAAHLRLEVGATEAAVTVFKGDLHVDSPSGVVELSKKQTGTFYLNDQGPHTLAKNVEDNPYDDWDKKQEEYAQRYAKNSPLSNSRYSYGASDLGYYGNFFNVAGYGTVWQPYFTGAGWDPFMNGVWAFYPGMGYGWASAYPWGWLPYHSGSWMFMPTYGWVWQPGGAWMGVINTPRPVNAPAGFRPPLAPTRPSRSLIAVGSGPMAPAGATSAQRLIIRNNSAGIGIPRGSIRNLNRMSQQAGQRGFATARVQPQATNPVMYRTMAPRNAPTTAASPNPSARPNASARQGAAPGNTSPRYSPPPSRPAYTPMPSPPMRSAPMGAAHAGGPGRR